MNRSIRLLAGLALGAAAALPARAEVTRFEVISRESPALQGRSFGDRGVAEKIVARATIAVDPSKAVNKVIADIDHAPRDAKGRVEATTDVLILRPAKPNGSMLVELPNRGGSQIIAMLDDTDNAGPARLTQAGDVGNGFLLEQGFTVVMIGWQGDLAGKGIVAQVPIAKGLTGRSRDQWTLTDTASPKRLTLSWPMADANNAILSMRPKANAAAGPAPGLAFRVIDDKTIEITRPPGDAAKGVYEFIYNAKDPAVMGLGFAALRDVATFLKRDGGPTNPIARGGRSTVDRAIATGISQTGRALRDVLYLGFNEDEGGRKVFDGMIPIIPGSRRSFTNARFSQPGRNPGPEWDQFFPVDQFPFTYAPIKDHLTGKTDGLLVRCTASKTCPQIMEVDSEYEFYGSRASLVVTDTEGGSLTLPANVRAYMIAGSPHSNRWNVVSTIDPRCVMASSPVVAAPAVRALLLDMDRWLTAGEAPPPSRFPSVADGTLVPAAEVYLPNMPVPYRGQYMHAHLIEQQDNGPVIKGDYPVLLPKAGVDGNVIAGIRLPIVAAPRATYTGWNPQLRLYGPEDLCDHAAGMTPFARTRAEKIANLDPRPSLDELYPTPDAYVAAVKAAADKLVADRLMLRADADAAIEAAKGVR